MYIRAKMAETIYFDLILLSSILFNQLHGCALCSEQGWIQDLSERGASYLFRKKKIQLPNLILLFLRYCASPEGFRTFPKQSSGGRIFHL